MTALTLKLDTLYLACSPGTRLVCYGQCQDEALNNLADELPQQEMEMESTGNQENSYAIN
jgi:hypothetical protein